MTVYMEITRDVYELPIAVADTMTELARLRGVDVSCVSVSINSKPKRKGAYRHKYVRVEVPED